ncbi:V-set and immunoglobulin domain-containing protein 10-like isoform X3 [Rhinatrema bivittatum]|uniref:V-set and immunoglobulin domain-containing protein 10-like isoform X3 n=1 Tax=Rhinatrema bivittatum TaxID=194408 RepID=UPI001129969D|nr:V-set and immunoglobulin domain-containing protein 10-like isoform X3 [Rhinatrema bivittatum]
MVCWGRSSRPGPRLPLLLLGLLLAGACGADGVTITASEQPLNFLTGDLITINIKVTNASALPMLTIVWLKDSKTMVIRSGNTTNIDSMYNGRLSMSLDGSINISNAMISDSASYTVKVDAMGEASAQRDFIVKVYDKVESVNVEISPEVVVEGNSTRVVLTCAVSSGTGNVTWTKDGQSLPQPGSEVQIENPRRTDSGTYVCTMTNPLSTGSGSRNLTVYYGPDSPIVMITSDRDPNPTQYVHLNSNVNLTCSADSNPLATYSWVENSGGPVVIGPILTKSNIQLSQAGQYSCVASNSRTNRMLSHPITLTVYEAPSNLSTSIRAFQEASGSMTVQIVGQGQYNPIVAQWLKDSKQLVSGGKYQLSNDSTQLTISNFTLEEDLGSYTFLCNNPLGGQNTTLAVVAPSISSCRVTRNADSKSAIVSWTVPQGAVITGFQVQMQGPALSRAAGDWQLLQNLSSADRSYLVSGLQPSATYTFRVVPQMGSMQGTPSSSQTVAPVSQGLSAGAIAGIVIGSVFGALLLIALLVLLICCVRKQKGKSKEVPPNPQAVRHPQSQLSPSNGKPQKSPIGASDSPAGPDFSSAFFTYRRSSISLYSASLPSNGSIRNGNHSAFNGSQQPTKSRSVTHV